jgi:hypothetical protein
MHGAVREREKPGATLLHLLTWRLLTCQLVGGYQRRSRSCSFDLTASALVRAPLPAPPYH